MKKRGIVSLFALSLFIVNFPATTEAWFATDHRVFALAAAKKCNKLPFPPKKRCGSIVDGNVLEYSLRAGSIAPDITDGSGSPKHAFNPSYDKSKYDSAIEATLGLKDADINEGGAILTINAEIENTKGKLEELKEEELNCDAGLMDYAKLWYQFGRLSHYPADLAVPLHT